MPSSSRIVKTMLFHALFALLVITAQAGLLHAADWSVQSKDDSAYYVDCNVTAGSGAEGTPAFYKEMSVVYFPWNFSGLSLTMKCTLKDYPINKQFTCVESAYDAMSGWKLVHDSSAVLNFHMYPPKNKICEQLYNNAHIALKSIQTW